MYMSFPHLLVNSTVKCALNMLNVFDTLFVQYGKKMQYSTYNDIRIDTLN